MPVAIAMIEIISDAIAQMPALPTMTSRAVLVV